MPNKWSYPPANILNRVEGAFPGNYRELWEALQAASQFPGAELTSWYRDPARNRGAGGAARSSHLLGLALDLYAPNLDELAQHLREKLKNYTVSVQVEQRPPHVHVQALSAREAQSPKFLELLRTFYPGRY